MISLIGTIVLSVAAARSSVGAQKYGFTGSTMTMAIIQTAFYSIAAVLEFIGVMATFQENVPLARIYAYGSTVGFLATCTASLLSIIIHFTRKDILISLCTAFNTGRREAIWYDDYYFWSEDGDGSGPAFTDVTANSYCNRRWNNSGPGVIISFLAIIVLGGMVISMSFMFLRQLLDPNFSRQRMQAAANTAVPMAPYGPGSGMGGGFYPPPPGAPPADSSYDYGYGYELRQDPHMPPRYERELEKDSAADRKSLSGPHGYGAFSTQRQSAGLEQESSHFNAEASGSRPASRNARAHSDEEQERDTGPRSPILSADR